MGLSVVILLVTVNAWIVGFEAYLKRLNAPLIAAWVGIATGLAAIATFATSISQRRKELRWKQAELARKLLDDLFANDDSGQGLDMLDGVKRRYKGFDDQAIDVNPADAVATVAKSLSGGDLDDREAKILFCVDIVLYFFNRIEGSLSSKLVLFLDVKTPCEYYVGLIACHKGVFSRYMEQAKYASVVHFCERFSAWRDGSE